MRTTVTLDDDTAQLLNRRVSECGVSFKQALNDAVRSGLRSPTSEPFRTPVRSLGVPTVNLDRALQLAAELEDEELLRKSRVD